MLDSYETFIKSDSVDDDTDPHSLGHEAIIKAVSDAMGLAF
jgi:hypothetical protein